jgi:hypothetical protein
VEFRPATLRTVVLLTVANVLLAVFVPAGAVLIHEPLSGADNFILGASLFSVGALTEVLFYVAWLRDKTDHEDEIWDTHQDMDSKLSSIRKSMRSLEVGVDPKRDLFLQSFRNRVVVLESDVRQTAGSKELRVDSQNLDLSGPLLDSFTGEPTDIIRLIHFLSANESSFFNVHEAQWFYRVYQCVRKRHVIEVRRLLLFESQEEIDDPKSLKLMHFLHATEHYNYRLLSKSDFDRLSKSFRLLGEFADFGIYGQRYLFRGLLYSQGDFVGVYSRDPETLSRYIDFFEFCWQSPTSRQIDVPSGPISLEQLFE